MPARLSLGAQPGALAPAPAPAARHPKPPLASGVARHARALVPAVVAYAALAIAMSAFVTDDALITLRYARQWAAGHGITWNTGEDPVEGFSNFSHVALGALALRAGIWPLVFLRAVNVLAAVGTIALSYALARRMVRSQLWAGAAALLVGAHPALAYWSVSGLETSAYGCALLLGVWGVHSGRYALAFAGLLAAALTRIEGAAVAGTVIAVQVGAALLRRRPGELRAQLPWMALFLLGYGAYFAWRQDYFGHALSNSAYYKGQSEAGATLLLEFAVQNAALLALVPFAPFRRLGTLGATLLALLVLYALGYYGVAPSVAYLHRFFVPVHPAAVLLAIAALQRTADTAPPLHWSRRLPVAGLAAVLAWDLLNTGSGIGAALYEVTDKGSRTGARAWVAAVVASRYPARSSVAMQDIGLVGYVLLNPIRDTFGLNSEAFTHRYAGRRDAYVRALVASKPDIVVLASKDPRRLRPVYGTDRLIARDPAFRRYRLTFAVRSPVEAYHYMVYTRDGLQLLPRRLDVHYDERATPVLLIETLASSAWNAQQRGRAVSRDR